MGKNFVSYAVVAGLIIVIVALFVAGGSQNSSINNSSRQANAANFFSQAVGKPAPDFSLEALDGSIVKLSDLKGKNVVLFFNEGEMCYPACWDQIKQFGLDSRFNSADTQAFSIVVDTRDQWQRIAQQDFEYKNAKILFDTEKTVSNEYGVLSLNSSMHPGIFPGHTYFLIDKNGIIQYAFDDPNMALRNNQLADEISKLK